MKTTQRLLNAALPIWESYYSHPFVSGIGDGTLPIDKFQFYMIQDHKYLMQYAKVFALGVVKASSEADMRLFSGLITATLDTENAVHQSYLKQLGISREMIEQTPMCLNNESYTNYMISIAFKEGMAELATAVLACSWSYKLIGDHMEQIPGSKDHPSYTSQSFRDCNDVMIDLVDRFSEGYSEEQLQNLEQIIINCSKYEYQFWEMSWRHGEIYLPDQN